MSKRNVKQENNGVVLTDGSSALDLAGQEDINSGELGVQEFHSPEADTNLDQALDTAQHQEEAPDQGETADQEETNTEEAPAVKNVVKLILRKTLSKRVINHVAAINNGDIEEGEDTVAISAPYIKVTRADIEAYLGAITDAKWRMILMNRVGEVRELTNREFILGVQNAESGEEETGRVVTQINLRVDKTLKDKIDKYRKVLGNGEKYSITAFCEDAIKEFINSVEKEIV